VRGDHTVGQHEETVIGEAVVHNHQGLHARPVMRFVDLAATFKSDILVEKANEPSDRVDGKSAMHMMLLCSPKGTVLRIHATGIDARQAVDALVDLARRHFDMGPES